MGLPEDVIAEQVEAERAACTFDLYAENVESVGVFLALRTQWRVVSGFHRPVHQGIDYTTVEPTMRVMGVPRARRADVFADLRIMEAAAVKVLNEPKGESG